MVATVLGTLGGSGGVARDINDAGQIVGSSKTAGGSCLAVVWNGTVATDLNTALGLGADWILTSATGINDDGWISADSYNTVTGQTHAFVIVTIPEPETYALALIGLGGVGFLVRRRRATSA